MNAAAPGGLRRPGDRHAHRASTRWPSGCRRACPTCVDFSNEPQGDARHATAPTCCSKGTFANNCLIARRLLERGVRFVQLMHAGWDQHGNLFTQLEQQCQDTDQPSAALVQDLKERGLLDDTLVIWGGEFGRTPFGQGDPAKPQRAATTSAGPSAGGWPAAASSRARSTARPTTSPGTSSTDPVHVHDMQATILHLLRHRPHAADVPLPGPPVPPDRRAREGGEGPAGVDALFDADLGRW